MKKRNLVLLALLFTQLFYAQVGIGTTSPDASAALDVRSEVSPGQRGGLKLPSVADNTERSQINTSTTSNGLLIYNESSRCIELYDTLNDNWVEVQCLPAITPTSVEFVNATSTLAEDGLLIDIEVSISNPSASTATTVEIALNGSSTATNGADYDDGSATPTSISFPATLTFPANSSANQSLTIYISNDDTDVEGNENVILDLQNPNGGTSAILGSNIQHTLTITDNDSNDLAFQDFDSNDNWNYTNDPSTYNTSNDVWDVVNTLPSIDNLNGNFWGARDLNNPNGGGGFTHELTFDAIDISGNTGVVFTFDYESQDLNASGDRYGYELIYDGTSQGQVDICAGCDNDLQGTVTENVPDTVDTFEVVLYGDFNGGSDLCAFDNIRLTN